MYNIYKELLVKIIHARGINSTSRNTKSAKGKQNHMLFEVIRLSMILGDKHETEL